VNTSPGAAAQLPRDRIVSALRAAAKHGQPALVAYLTAGFPDREKFREHLQAVAAEADVVEVGVPFSDPMADGVTIQRSSEQALRAGVTLAWILDELDESEELRSALAPHGLALVQMVTPVTPPERLARVASASQGFVYAVTMTGTTGHVIAAPRDIADYLVRVRAAALVPVCAGFGIRSREQVDALRGLVDGVIIGSALVEVVERGESAQQWLATLRPPRR
jgi:tryptophan synthase alpha chain